MDSAGSCNPEHEDCRPFARILCRNVWIFQEVEQEEAEATEEESLVLGSLRYLLFKIFTDIVGKFRKLFLSTGLCPGVR